MAKKPDKDRELKRKLDFLNREIEVHRKALVDSKRAAEQTRQEVKVEREERQQKEERSP